MTRDVRTNSREDDAPCLRLLFDALSGQMSQQDCCTASSILNAETI